MPLTSSRIVPRPGAALDAVRIHVVVISWQGQRRAALEIARAVHPALGPRDRLSVIYSNLAGLRESGPGHWEQVPQNWYFGAKFAHSLKLVRDAEAMLQIQADALSADWPGVLDGLVAARRTRPDLGVWAPSLHWTPYPPQIAVLQRAGRTGGMYHVAQTDGVVWALDRTICARLEQLDFGGNTLGWGIDYAAIAIARAAGRVVLCDTAISVGHPPSRGYSGTLAGTQMNDFGEQLSRVERQGFKSLQRFVRRRGMEDRNTARRWHFIWQGDECAMTERFRNLAQDILVRQGRVLVRGVPDLPEQDVSFRLNDVALSLVALDDGPTPDDVPIIFGLMASQGDSHVLDVNGLGEWQIDGLDTARLAIRDLQTPLSVPLGPPVTLPGGTGDLQLGVALAAHRTNAVLRLHLSTEGGDGPVPEGPGDVSVMVDDDFPGGDRIEGYQRSVLRIPGAAMPRRAQLFVEYPGGRDAADTDPPTVFVAFPHITRAAALPDMVWPHRVWGNWLDDSRWFELAGLDGPLAPDDRLELIDGETRQSLLPRAPKIEAEIGAGRLRARTASGSCAAGLWVGEVPLVSVDLGGEWQSFDLTDVVELGGENPVITLRDASGSRIFWQGHPTAEALTGGAPSEDQVALASNADLVAAFDTAFYTAGFAAGTAPRDPIVHYLTEGWKEGRDPAPWFSTRHYLASFPDVKRVGMNPFAHYILQGIRENRRLVPLGQGAKRLYDAQSFAVSQGPLYEDVDVGIGTGRTPRAKVIAYYLPQFHRTDVNDLNWGAGFTEWRNLPRGLPRFEGHVQPRVPRDLGFYDLETGEVLRRQIEMARTAGLHGFCFYHYWFDGQRVLDTPMEQLLADPSLDFPFCLMWANENWTRTWDGEENDVLLQQNYRPEEDEAFVDDLARHLRDPRYMRVSGRPILFIYRPGHIPDPVATIDRWRAIFRDRHGMSPLLYMAQSFGDTDPRIYGLDGAIEFPPHKLTNHLPDIAERLPMIDTDYQGRILEYDGLVQVAAREPAPEYPLIRTVVPNWDNDARRPGRGMILEGSTPAKFEDWVSRSISFARTYPAHGERIVCVNAWNEWAEGALLEPDVHFGGAYLNALARAVFDVPRHTASTKTRVLIVGHDAHEHGAQLLALNIGRILTRQFGVEVHYLLGAGGRLLDRFRDLGPTDVIPFSHVHFEERLWALRAEGVSLAITNTTVCGAAAPALKSTGFRVVSLVHELRKVLEGVDLAARAKALAVHSDHVIFPAHVVRESFETVAGKVTGRADILPQGVYRKELVSKVDGLRAAGGVRAELDLPEDAKVVLNLGSIDLRKGVDHFVSVAIALCARRENLYFVWAGPTARNSLDWLLFDIARAGLTDRIRLTDFTDDVASWYAAADLFFLASREDPFPSVVLEALSTGLPVVGFRGTGGCDDLIARHGALVETGNRDAAALAIADLLDQSAAVAQDAVHARREEMARNYRFDSYCHGLLQRFDDSLASVSVVVPNYNYARHLPTRLGSIFRQTFPVLEVLVLDDASTDDSLHVIEKTAQTAGRDVILVPGETNSGGPFPQWRKGVRMARGEYVWIAEADDLATPDMLERLVERMRNAGSAIGFCDSWQMDDCGTLTGESYAPYLNDIEPEAFDESFDLDGATFLSRFLAVKNVILNVSCAVFRRDALLAAIERLGEDLDTYRVAGDWRLYAEICAAGGGVSYEASALNGHRRHGGSVTHSLEIEPHLSEIAAMQDFAGCRTEVSGDTVARQKAHLEACRAHLESL